MGKTMKVQVGGKTVGVYDEKTLTFTKHVKKSRHFLWKLSSWGIDKAVVSGLFARGCKHIVIIDDESGTEYSCDVGTYIELGKTQNLGHGEQVFLYSGHFTIKTPGDDKQEELIKVARVSQKALKQLRDSL